MGVRVIYASQSFWQEQAAERDESTEPRGWGGALTRDNLGNGGLKTPP